MTRAIALALTARRPLAAEALRLAIVHGCALALICAGRALPGIG